MEPARFWIQEDVYYAYNAKWNIIVKSPCV